MKLIFSEVVDNEKLGKVNVPVLISAGEYAEKNSVSFGVVVLEKINHSMLSTSH